jgi:benzodiazapine receptor
MNIGAKPLIRPGESGQNHLIAFLVFSGLTAAVYIFSGIITATSVSGWYQTIDKPSFNPPNWVFTPVWSVLYLMIAIATWMAWRRSRNYQRKLVVRAFGLQLWLNLLWSILFFGLQWVGAALVDIVLLWASIIWTVCVFWPIDRRAAIMFVTYGCWVAFAIVLNAAIWNLN